MTTMTRRDALGAVSALSTLPIAATPSTALSERESGVTTRRTLKAEPAATEDTQINHHLRCLAVLLGAGVEAETYIADFRRREDRREHMVVTFYEPRQAFNGDGLYMVGRSMLWDTPIATYVSATDMLSADGHRLFRFDIHHGSGYPDATNRGLSWYEEPRLNKLIWKSIPTPVWANKAVS